MLLIGVEVREHHSGTPKTLRSVKNRPAPSKMGQIVSNGTIELFNDVTRRLTCPTTALKVVTDACELELR